MKKILILTICNSLLFIATTTISFAYTFAMEDFTGTYTYGNSNQGTYLGTVYSENGSNANDDIATLTNFFNWKGMTVDSLSLYGKDEDGDLFITLSETDDEGQYKSGTWQTFDPSATQPIQPDVISFLIVKGGQSFSVHQYDPSAYSGEWNIGYLDENPNGNPPTLSHLSGFITTINPVPEPATMLLFGIGLLGLAGVGRKKK